MSKQKVHLVCNVFNEKNGAVLQQKKYDDTSIFINCVTRMWNILNIKSPAVGHGLDDVNRLPFTDQRDERLVL